ncbi:MAG: asparagine synthase (glutamine-hydrolyzing) [Myxococcota bacterium]
MCGIGGVAFHDGSPPAAETLGRMADAMRERGPDDEGCWVGEGVGLVHRRLSIIDLSPAGRCPMPNEDGSVQVVHNGEIYNFEALRRELLQRGHRFRSRCDSEVIVHGFEEWGAGLVERLDGMFAFAVWDASRRELFLARDRLGEKPLYYREHARGIAFASTLGALQAAFEGALEVEPAAIECFLCHSFIPAPHTVWKGVQALPPAHHAFWAPGRDLRVERYWDFPPPARREVSVAEAERATEVALERAVRERLVADVPVGGFLSGGVDSSLVMALAARHARAIDTFSIGFAERDFSELPHARRVAEVIGSSHHELVLGENELLDVVPELVWQYGQPFGDSSAIPTHWVSRFTRGQVTVSLSGDGGDESFAGYWRAAAGSWAARYGRVVPETLRHSVVPGLCRSLGAFGASALAGRLGAMNRLSLAPPGAGYTNATSWFDHREELFAEALRAGASHDPVACRSGKPLPYPEASVLQQVLYDDYQVQLADDYLVKVDVASMAASLEVRAPFLDHHFVEAAWHLPDAYKLRYGSRKWLLKRIAARLVPREVVFRPKAGFALPMKHWWRGRLASLLRELLVDSRCVARGWIRAEPVLRRLDEHVAGRAAHDVRLWLILWLELWARIVLEGSLARSTSLRKAA